MTPFLFSIKDLDRLKIYYNNMKDLLIRSKPYLTAPINYVDYTATLDILLSDDYIKPYNA
ncbi:hypothetical protein TSTA_001170 [Talaromyces stipitatus ATCC 10500]|uniref:Uncharacterized protein n=1 Tax=Talaromyces stipitatus (strain ATCC 10500 / CBS 375.48 / QM 6759 / NRRL 1006) TaxID=441959 RepID=B8MS00_TALSN|nr:uncharacterized protein TSTA_001170 [Talaromyces stipitatus ATCC 10500]EED12045.1 hypothetical protein TSTA_001170 [Talaromyces stipitatus ATCC 10500]